MKKFDKEYSTQWIKEVEWLQKHNVFYVFVKTDYNNITTYKFKKTAQLFLWLFIFYSLNKNGD